MRSKTNNGVHFSWKKDSTTSVFLWTLRNFSEQFFYRTLVKAYESLWIQFETAWYLRYRRLHAIKVKCIFQPRVTFIGRIFVYIIFLIRNLYIYFPQNKNMITNNLKAMVLRHAFAKDFLKQRFREKNRKTVNWKHFIRYL